LPGPRCWQRERWPPNCERRPPRQRQPSSQHICQSGRQRSWRKSRGKQWGLRRNADILGTFAHGTQHSWQSHANYLDGVREHINAVGERIAELQRIRDSVLPWQQQAITEVTTHTAQVAASTQAAIVQLNDNRNSPLLSEYRDHLRTIEDSSAAMKERVDKYLNYEKAQQKFQQLSNELELEG
jgi:hypothetical protein